MARVKPAAEKDYLAIARRHITTPSQVKQRPRLLVYSRNKKGKTRFGMTAEDVLMVDPESGTDAYTTRNPDVWHVTSWNMLQDVIGALRTNELTSPVTGRPYKWVDFDGMTRINKLALKYVKKLREEAVLETVPGLVDRRDYFKSSELMNELIMQIHALPQGVIFSCQERVMTIDPDEGADETLEASTFYVPDLPAAPRGAINSVVWVIGRLYVATASFKNRKGEVIEKPQRRLWVGDHPQYDTGYRSEFELPKFIKEPTVPKLMELLSSGQPS